MTPEGYQWYINLVKDRYQYLNLTYEQAEKIYTYEKDRDSYSHKYFFSAWEEWDYELTTFREILNQEQLKIYEIFLSENIERYKESLTEQDHEKTNEVAYYEEIINFYETHFLLDLFKDPYFGFGWLVADGSKIDYIRAEYKRFLNETKKEILTDHFRYNRTFKPNQLKVSMLRHKVSCIFPDYISFKHKMDEPTKAVANYLITKLWYPDELNELLKRKFEELKDFNDANFRKYYGNTGGWHVALGHWTPEEERENHTMSLILLDKQKYGF